MTNLPQVDVMHLHPGDLICRRRPLVLTTLLGSCVAVALWDRRLRFGGMIHALLPQAPAEQPPLARFVDTGITLLVERMADLGSRRGDIEAKLFGGADVLPQSSAGRTVGERNIAAAMTRLETYDIAITAARIGGTTGIVIKVSTGTGAALVRQVATVDDDVVAMEPCHCGLPLCADAVGETWSW